MLGRAEHDYTGGDRCGRGGKDESRAEKKEAALVGVCTLSSSCRAAAAEASDVGSLSTIRWRRSPCWSPTLSTLSSFCRLNLISSAPFGFRASLNVSCQGRTLRQQVRTVAGSDGGAHCDVALGGDKLEKLNHRLARRNLDPALTAWRPNSQRHRHTAVSLAHFVSVGSHLTPPLSTFSCAPTLASWHSGGGNLPLPTLNFEHPTGVRWTNLESFQIQNFFLSRFRSHEFFQSFVGVSCSGLQKSCPPSVKSTRFECLKLIMI